MRPEQAEEIGRLCYANHPAAAPLILELLHGATEERRRRSVRALEWLDEAERDPEFPPITSQLAGPARAIAFVLLRAVYSTEPAERARVAGLLEALCAEASALSRRRAA